MRMTWAGLLSVGAVGLASCAVDVGAPDLPMPPDQLEVFWKRTHFKPRADLQVDPHQRAPGVLERNAVSTNVGDIKVIEGDSTNVSSVNSGGQQGFALRFDQQRQDLARITEQIITEEGDHFDFVVVFPTFEDLANPGFAYFNPIKSVESGIGQPAVDQSQFFGSNGRLQGFLNMNSPSAYTSVDGRPISDSASAAFPIMGQELTHRWLAFAQFRKEGFNNGQTSDALLGRDGAHWSALMQTGPADPAAPLYSSVQDGVAWRDNNDGSFTALDVFSDTRFNISERSRFSTLDLYLMGLYAPEEVEPFFIINNARFGNQTVEATSVLSRNISITGTRLDITIDDIQAAMGPRIPSVANSQKDFNVAVVVLTAPGQTTEDVQNVVAEVQAFRQQWEVLFSEWTGGRGSVCTALTGNCATARVRLTGVELTEAEPDGVLLPGEGFTVAVSVENSGSAEGLPATASASATGGTIATAQQALGSLAAGASQVVEFSGTVDAATPCGGALDVTATLTLEGLPPATLRLHRELGLVVASEEHLEGIGSGWRVNPDQADTATAGRWARGRPARVDLRRFGLSEVLTQPDGDATPTGEFAYFTDASGNSANVGDTDVDDGFTTLETNALNVAGLVDPVLNLNVWHAALVIDVDAGELRQGVGDDLVILGSTDGQTFVELARDTESLTTWHPVSVRLRDVAGLNIAQASTLLVRFVVQDVDEQNVVEAGVDDLVLTDLDPRCNSNTGSSSSGGGTSSSGGGASSSSGGGSSSGGNASSSGGAQTPASSSSSGGAPAINGCACTVPDTAPGRTGLTLGGALLGLLLLRRSRRR